MVSTGLTIGLMKQNLTCQSTFHSSLNSLVNMLSYIYLFIKRIRGKHLLLEDIFIIGILLAATCLSGELIFNIEKIISSKNLLSLFSNNLSIYHLDLIFIGILFTFSSIHFLGFNIMPRRIPDFPDSFYSWNLLSV